MKALLAFVLGGGLVLVAPSVRAQGPDLAKECSAEVAKYCPDAKSNDEVMSCIEKREKMGKKRSGLSHKCYEAHEKLESPEQEKGEKHEGAEHK